MPTEDRDHQKRSDVHGYRELADLVDAVTSGAATVADIADAVTAATRRLVAARRVSCELVADGAPPPAAELWSPADEPGAEGPVSRRGEHGAIVVPLTGADGAHLGQLQLSDPDHGEFTELDQQLAELLAAIGSSALERCRLAESAGTDRRHLEAVNDALPGGILVRDTRGRILYSNTWIAEYLGIDHDGVRDSEPGEPYQLIDELGEVLPDDAYPSVRACRGEHFDATVVGMPHPDGRVRWLATSGRPLVGDDGRVIGGLIVFVDTTGPVEDRRRLVHSERLLRDAERLAQIGSWSRDLRTGDTTVSDGFRRLFGLGDDELVTRTTVYDLVAPDDRPTLLERTHRTFTEGTPCSIELRMIDRSGADRSVQIEAARYDGLDGRPAGIFGTVRDLTAERAHDERLARADRMEMVGRLAGGLAHDFNNLLTVLTGHAELLRTTATAEQMPSIDAITASTERAATLTKQLLEFGGREVLQPVAVDANALVERLFDMARSVVPTTIDIALELDPDGAVVFADPQKLEQVLLNLIFNARDALVTSGGTITIRTATGHHADPVLELNGDPRALDGYVLMEVADDGPGMEVDVLERALEPFFTTKAPGTGTGLGLSTSYGIVAQSGGHLTLASTPGEGTTATVVLPRSTDPTGLPAAPPVASVDIANTATILLVEDEDQLRPLLERVLVRLGHHVLTAADGSDALEVAARWGRAIDLLVTDVSMPGRNGHDLATELVAVHPQLRVIFMSGYTENSVVVNGVVNRDINFLAKPFSMADLSSIVNDVLASPDGHPPA